MRTEWRKGYDRVGKVHTHALETGLDERATLWQEAAVTRYNVGNRVRITYPSSKRYEAYINERVVQFTPTEYAILEMIAIRGPRLFMSFPEITDALYGHRIDGGPLDASRVISGMLLRMREKGVPYEVLYGWGVRIADKING